MKLLNQLNNETKKTVQTTSGQKKPTTQATLLNMQTDSLQSSEHKPRMFPTHMRRLSPKALPSMFTYQDNSSELSGEGKAIGLVGPDGIDLFDSSSPRRHEYIPTQERYRQQGRVYVELRYCMSCKQNQPLRAKHCRKCEHCIATHDHHCPWLGNCVGERNKGFFYVYLWSQQLLIALLMALAVRLVLKNQHVVLAWITLVVGIGFSLFLLNLILFHSYIITKNITTWEFLSWSKVSYLKEWPRRHGSPFDLGFWANLKLVFMYTQQTGNHFIWKMPYRLPDYQSQ